MQDTSALYSWLEGVEKRTPLRFARLMDKSISRFFLFSGSSFSGSDCESIISNAESSTAACRKLRHVDTL